MSSTLKTLAFEIGTEEIPAFDLKDATEKLPELVAQALSDARIPHGEISVMSTPRRFDIVVKDIADQTEAVKIEHKGPSVKIAFDELGNPTGAATGFARGKGVNVDDLEVRSVDDTEYIYAVVSIPSANTSDLLPELLIGIIEGISWPKSMRWNVHRELFSRPIRWILAMLDSTVINFEYAGIQSGNKIFGHRIFSPGSHVVESANQLEATLDKLHIIPTMHDRQDIIFAGVSDAENSNPGCNVVIPPKTLAEVVNLTEFPTVLVGSFDESFLEVPEEIIVDAMLMHQRYFPMYKDGKLTNKFIIISNGDPDFSSNIIEGNERVVAARLYDAKFFYTEDLKTPLENYVNKLDDVVFQEKLGTMRDKTNRVEQLASRICLDALLDAATQQNVSRAARLAKADLVTNAVVEFTSVQGIMGSYYAAASGENDEVATAISEHYMPRFSGDDVPSNIVGKIVAFADKLDTICGLFAIGQAPTGSADPFALRRSALGIIAILTSGLEVSLQKAIVDSLNIYAESNIEFDKEKVLDEITEFFTTRCRVSLRDEGYDVRVVDAILATGQTEPVAIIDRTKALSLAIEQSPDTFEDLSIAFSRADNLRDSKLGVDIDASLFNDSEIKLHEAIESTRANVSISLDEKLYSQALSALSCLRGPIDNFFETTMIMDENENLRNNRIRLLNRLVEAFSGIADFSMISRKSK